MSQLRSCYFCGAVGDSLREYDVPPERLVPAEQSRSAVLCSACHEKLRRVFEPLTDAHPSDSSAAPGSSLQEVTFDDDVGRDAHETREDGDDADESGVDDVAENGDDTDANASDDADETPVEGDDAGTAAPDVDDDTPADSVDSDTTDTDDAASNGRATGDPDVPDGYYKVLRLLQNREFPMERADLTALVTAAYDVSPPQCERILETAIERGVLVENGSTIDLGRN